MTTKPNGSEFDKAFQRADGGLAALAFEHVRVCREFSEEIERLRGLVAELRAIAMRATDGAVRDGDRLEDCLEALEVEGREVLRLREFCGIQARGIEAGGFLNGPTSSAVRALLAESKGP